MACRHASACEACARRTAWSPDAVALTLQGFCIRKRTFDQLVLVRLFPSAAGVTNQTWDYTICPIETSLTECTKNGYVHAGINEGHGEGRTPRGRCCMHMLSGTSESLFILEHTKNRNGIFFSLDCANIFFILLRH